MPSPNTDAPRLGLDAAMVERLRQEYAPEPEPRDCLRISCGYRGPLTPVRTDDAGWRGWCCPRCGESLRYTAPGDPDVLALLREYQRALEHIKELERKLEAQH